MNEKLNVIVLTEDQIKQIITETIESVIEIRIPELMRKVNRKEILTTNELKELTGMSYRMQKYHRENGNLPYSQDGRRIFYLTIDVERFIADRKVGVTD